MYISAKSWQPCTSQCNFKAEQLKASLLVTSCYTLLSLSLYFFRSLLTLLWLTDLRKRTTKPNIETYSEVRECRGVGECDVGSGPPNSHMTPGQVKPDNNNGPTRAQTTMEQRYLCMYICTYVCSMYVYIDRGSSACLCFHTAVALQ